MSTQYRTIGTGLSNFRSNTIKTFVDTSRAQGSPWGTFGRPEFIVKSNPNYKCDIKSTGWLDTYNRDGALNDLVTSYTFERSKHDSVVQASILTNSFAFDCNLAHTLNIDFSINFADMIERLTAIVNEYVVLISNKNNVQSVEDIDNKIKWISSELLPTLCVWITELHIERVSLPIYNDRILNYIGQVFLLLQGQTYCVQGQKIMELCKQMTSSNDIKERIPGFTQVLNGTLATEFSDIDAGIKEIINHVNDDLVFTDLERNITLAAIYDLLSKTDKAFAKDPYFNKSDNGRMYLNTLTSHYHQWLNEVDKDCKLVNKSNNNLLKGNGSGIDVKDSVCPSWMRSRKSINPAMIKHLNAYPIIPVV